MRKSAFEQRPTRRGVPTGQGANHRVHQTHRATGPDRVSNGSHLACCSADSVRCCVSRGRSGSESSRLPCFNPFPTERNGRTDRLRSTVQGIAVCTVQELITCDLVACWDYVYLCRASAQKTHLIGCDGPLERRAGRGEAQQCAHRILRAALNQAPGFNKRLLP